MPGRHIRRLIAELRRRKVFRATGVYLVVGWLLLQVGDIVVEPLRLPDWTMPLLIVLVALGVPVVVALAWVFDLGRHGLRRESVPPPVPAGPAVASEAGSSRAAAYVGIGILVGLVGFGAYAYRGGSDERPAAITSVAVLPFENRSGDASDEYFSDGITEELLDALGRIEGLRVPARTSSFQFKGRQVDVREVGRRLNVQAVLDGSVQKVGRRVRIRAQLVDAVSGYEIWTEEYDHELADIFALQDEIGRAIVAALRLTLAPGGAPSRTGPATLSIEAHDHYLLGRYHFHRRGPVALREAERHFRAAVAADPDYAEAHAGLALTYAVLPLFDPAAGVEEAVREGTAAAQRALSLDSALADAHAALGQIAQNFEWDWEAAEGHYTRAVELAPNDATVRQWHAEVMVVRGDPGAAAAVEAAVSLDPLSPIANTVAALAHLLGSRDFERSAHFWHRVEELDPEFPLLRDLSAFTFVALGDWAGVRSRLLVSASTAADSQDVSRWLDAAATLRRGGTLDAGTRDRALAAAHGFGGRALGDVGRLKLTAVIDPAPALDLLVVMLDDPELRQPSTWLPRFWFFDSVREDPRYRRVLRTVGLEDGAPVGG